MFQKRCVVVAVMCDSKVLVAVDQHQGYEILDLLGAVLNDDESAIDGANRALVGHVGGQYELTPFGRFTDNITKPEGVVELIADAYIVQLDSVERVMSNPNRPTIWLTRDELSNDPRNRRNKRLFDKYFEDQPINLVFSEDQMGLWIDAMITDWQEK